MSMNIITGHRGFNHVDSEEIRAINAGTIGVERYVFDIGEKFDYEIISNNIVRIKNGYGVNQGTGFGIKVTDYEEVAIDNGLAGVLRRDLIVARYEKDIVSGIENVSLVVIKGVSSENPVDPTYNTGNILENAIIDDFPLWRVNINELSITSIEQMFVISKNIQDLFASIGDVASLTTSSKVLVGAINEIIGYTNLESNSKFLTVGVVGAQFSTINSAITYAQTYCSSINRVTIFVYPGVYNEEIIMYGNQGIDIIGSGYNNTIVQYSSVYPNAPIYTIGEGYFEGITFNSTGTDSYGLHYDVGNTSVTGNTVFKNCKFISADRPSVGIGTGENCKIVLDECILHSNTKESMYFHNNPNSNKLNQYIEVINCSLESQLNNVYINIDDACSIYSGTNSQLYITFKNNTTKDSGKIYFRKNIGVEYSYIPKDDSNLHILADSIGNNLFGLTYEKSDITIVGHSVKSSNAIPGSSPSYYLYSVSFKDANKYDWTLVNVSAVGIGDITASCEYLESGTNYILIKDNTATGAGYLIQITLDGTAK